MMSELSWSFSLSLLLFGFELISGVLLWLAAWPISATFDIIFEFSVSSDHVNIIVVVLVSPGFIISFFNSLFTNLPSIIFHFGLSAGLNFNPVGT